MTKKAAADTKYMKIATGKVRLYKHKCREGIMTNVHASRRSIITSAVVHENVRTPHN